MAESRIKTSAKNKKTSDKNNVVDPTIEERMRQFANLMIDRIIEEQSRGNFASGGEDG